MEINLIGKRLVFGLLSPKETAKDLPDEEIESVLKKGSIEVKATMGTGRKEAWYFEGTYFLDIEQVGDRQRLIGIKPDPHVASVFYLVSINGSGGGPEFYKVPTEDLQEILFQEYGKRLKRHDGTREHNPKVTNLSQKAKVFARFKLNPENTRRT